MWQQINHLSFWLALPQIVGIDLVLSGDNAVVIALAARALVGRDRRMALLIGGVTAIIFRMFLTIIAAGLLSFPFIMTAGGVLLFWVALRLVKGRHESHQESDIPATSQLTQAIRAIVIADVVMSLDNVLSVAAIARGNPLLLLFGLMLSIPLIIVGSTFLMHLMNRFKSIIVLAGALLGYVSVDMILSDFAWRSYLSQISSVNHTILALFGALLIFILSRPSRSRAAKSP
ncbi:TerC family protein [Ferrovum sp. PN-J185]|uniref:TerC family protein n=1 Tax=Ferrovum sp. PN-J185 TaxID=1356306 RepID=UPI000794341A|nr:TerC family protein [Ferrovum sp. PN-J185]KXW56520.1 integral membrane protein TerC family protein [Ferrovum sp. PN-J185]MCC6068131.1 TerC family protein [Ferrovum sp. PN-J185]MDE1891756.1 TerC family protein [Betaproteobacteria bacterium]MDE2056402.1 TerC family protein [Betaproteobacteria bacterium]